MTCEPEGYTVYNFADGPNDSVAVVYDRGIVWATNYMAGPASYEFHAPVYGSSWCIGQAYELSPEERDLLESCPSYYKVVDLRVTEVLLEEVAKRRQPWLPEGYDEGGWMYNDDQTVLVMVGGPFPDEIPDDAHDVTALYQRRDDGLFMRWRYQGREVGDWMFVSDAPPPLLALPEPVAVRPQGADVSALPALPARALRGSMEQRDIIALGEPD